MKLKRILPCFLAVLISLAAIFSLTMPLVRGNGDTIPTGYYQQLNLNGTYVYNVTAFGTEGTWFNYTYGTEGNFLSNPGGQIHVNFSGFYNRDPNDSGDYCDFPDTNMPWMDIIVYNKTPSGLNEYFKLENRSNSEMAFNLALNYMSFNAGFLVPKNWTWLNDTAYSNAVAGGADLTVEESHHFVFFDFDQAGVQRTKLIYEKSTGLLVSANTSLAWNGYNLVIQSLNFTLDYNKSYNYNVSRFGSPITWVNLTWDPIGVYKTNPTGVIRINFTGDYDKDPNDFFNVFDSPMTWLDIEVIENISGSLTTNFTLLNRSNGEVASNLYLGFNSFASGFRIPVNNLSYIKQLAIEQADSGVQGNVSILETALTLKIKFDQYPSGQKTYLIYEKLTGLLLWVNTSLGNTLLEMVIEGYTPWLDDAAPETGPPSPPTGDIVFLPYLIVIIASVAIVVPFELGSRTSSKTKKYALLAMIAASSFSGLLFFNNNMNLLLGSSTLNQRVDNITLIVDYGNGTVYESPSFTLLGGKTTAYDALDAWCTAELKSFAGLGNQVVVINGYKPSGGWTYSIPGRYAGEVTTTGLNNGDTVRFTAH